MAVLSGFFCGDNDGIYGVTSSGRKDEIDDDDALAAPIVFSCSDNNYMPTEICAKGENNLKTNQSVNESATKQPLGNGRSSELIITKMHLNQCIDYICLMTSAMLSFLLNGCGLCISFQRKRFGLLAVFIVLLNGLATAVVAANVGAVTTNLIEAMPEQCKFLKPVMLSPFLPFLFILNLLQYKINHIFETQFINICRL